MRYHLDKVYGDKAYDKRKNFNILDDLNAEPTSCIRKNASTRSKVCSLRRDEVLLIKNVSIILRVTQNKTCFGMTLSKLFNMMLIFGC